MEKSSYKVIRVDGTETVHKGTHFIEIAGELRRETEKAYLLFDGGKEVWIAKSLEEWDP